MTSQLDELTATYSQLCDHSTARLQQLEQEQAKEEQRKVEWMEGGRVTGKAKGKREEKGGSSRKLTSELPMRAYDIAVQVCCSLTMSVCLLWILRF